MNWAARRRLIIVLILVTVGLAIVGGILFATLYQAPSCSDKKQNQDEAGVDCGGSCAYLCTAQKTPPTVLFSLLLPTNTGRTDFVALVENKNTDAAAKKVPYKISLYTSGQALVRVLQGTIDLPPHTSVPIYVPNVGSTGQVARVFLEIASSSPRWFTLTSATDPRIIPTVANKPLVGADSSTPRVEAVLGNADVSPMFNVHAVVLVHGTSGNVIAASETVLQTIPAHGQATAIFTWNEAFPGTPVSVEVLPIIPLL